MSDEETKRAFAKSLKGMMGFVHEVGTCGNCNHARRLKEDEKTCLYTHECQLTELCFFAVEAKNSCERHQEKIEP